MCLTSDLLHADRDQRIHHRRLSTTGELVILTLISILSLLLPHSQLHLCPRVARSGLAKCRLHSSFTAAFRRTLPRQKQRYRKLNLARRHTPILNKFGKVLRDLFERTWCLCLDSRYYWYEGRPLGEAARRGSQAASALHRALHRPPSDCR